MEIRTNQTFVLAVLISLIASLSSGCYCPAQRSCPVAQPRKSTAAEEKPKSYGTGRDDVIEWLKSQNGYNDHVRKVVSYAELLNKESTTSADTHVVEIAALLHDCGYQVGKGLSKQVRKRHADIGAKAARRLLPSVGFSSDFTGHVSRIVAAHHSVTKMETTEWRMVWMADMAVNKEMDVTGKTAGKTLNKLQATLEKKRAEADTRKSG